ncbi:unnamed protein product [Ectocarpus sp. CCAP 1310/34]|nr:unnamed protein product [Ectocarpus sp. CCAP 1310/34]
MTSPIGQKPSDVEGVPMMYKNLMCSKYKVFWEAAMKKDIDGHDKTGTFPKVKELPEGRKAIGSKWVFSWKTNEKGLIVDSKARMVARGFSRIPGIDFHHSSSACPSAASIKTVIAVATEKGKKLAHWDVKQAYIHAKLTEEIYLRFPEGCGSMSGKVVKVERALYGLMQSGREWGFEAADALIENGYKQCRVDPCVFRKVVDGEVFAFLNKKSPVKDLGECTWYDGCAIAMDVENGITKLSQTAYIESMLKRFDVTTTAFTPAATDADLGPKRDDEPAVDKPVREAIGCLMWTKLTRPDIALPLNKLQKIAHSPTGRIWNALVRIMSYLNFTKDFGITYVRGSGLDLSVFVDASYADNEVDRRSTTGLAGVKEALFVRGVLSFIAPETSGAKIKVLEDNKGALALIENPFSSRGASTSTCGSITFASYSSRARSLQRSVVPARHPRLEPRNAESVASGWELPMNWITPDSAHKGEPRHGGRLILRYSSDPATGCAPKWKLRETLMAHVLAGDNPHELR